MPSHARRGYKRRDALAKRNNIFDVTNRQKLAVPPHVRRAMQEVILTNCTRDAFQIVPDDEGFAGL
jgi:hypothetical protein